jgi:hypothetical protein
MKGSYVGDSNRNMKMKKTTEFCFWKIENGNCLYVSVLLQSPPSTTAVAGFFIIRKELK